MDSFTPAEYMSRKANIVSSANCSKCMNIHVNDAISLKVQIAALHGTISDLRVALTKQAHADRLRISDLNRSNTELNSEIRVLRETNDELNQERVSLLDRLCKLENTVLALERKNNEVESARRVDEDLRLRAETSRSKVENLLVSILSSCEKMTVEAKLADSEISQLPPPPLNTLVETPPQSKTPKREAKPHVQPSPYLGEPPFAQVQTSPTPSRREPERWNGNILQSHYQTRRPVETTLVPRSTEMNTTKQAEPVFLDRNMKQYLIQIFEKADKNHDGQISAIEVIKSIKHNPELMDLMGVQGKTREQKKDYLIYKMSEMDENNDGTMSLNEFLHWYKSTIHPNGTVSTKQNLRVTQPESRETELTKRIEQLERKYSTLLEQERKKWKSQSLGRETQIPMVISPNPSVRSDYSTMQIESRSPKIKPGESYVKKIEETERKIREFLTMSRASAKI